MVFAAMNRTTAIFCTFFIALLSVSAFGQAGLTLGGHFVPKDSFMLFIDLGNSAMSGRDKSPDTIAHPHLWKFEMKPANYDWLPAREPVCDDGTNSIANPKGSPIMPFLKRLAVNYPNYYFGVMQLSGSGWELQGHFNPGAGDVTSLLTQANLLKPNVTIAGIVSMLNLVEVQVKDTLNYLSKVVSMVSNVRSVLGALQYQGVTYTLPYLHAGYPVMARSNTTASYDTSLAQAKSIIRQIAQIQANVTYSVVIPTDSCPICTTCTPLGYLSHYDRPGNLRWGGRAADTIKARCWIPPACNTFADAPQHQIAMFHTFSLQKIMFDGTNWSAFDKAGKSIDVFSPNGRAITGTSAAALKNLNLLPGVYFVRKDVKK
jgi:hypothetical protein